MLSLVKRIIGKYLRPYSSIPIKSISSVGDSVGLVVIVGDHVGSVDGRMEVLGFPEGFIDKEGSNDALGLLEGLVDDDGDSDGFNDNNNDGNDQQFSSLYIQCIGNTAVFRPTFIYTLFFVISAIATKTNP